MPRGGRRKGAGRKRCPWRSVFMRVPEPLREEFRKRIESFKKSTESLDEEPSDTEGPTSAEMPSSANEPSRQD